MYITPVLTNVTAIELIIMLMVSKTGFMDFLKAINNNPITNARTPEGIIHKTVVAVNP